MLRGAYAKSIAAEPSPAYENFKIWAIRPNLVGFRVSKLPRPGDGMKLIRLTEVMLLVGLKKSAIYDRIKDNKFPAPIKIGGASRWPDQEINAWIALQIARSRQSETWTNVA